WGATVRKSAAARATLPRSLPPMIPPPAVKEELMRRIAATTPARLDASRRRPRPLVWAVGTVAAVIAAAAFTGTYVASRYEAQLGVMARESAALRARVEREELALREQLAVYQNAADLLRDPQAQ